jgi:hypothetical protein
MGYAIGIILALVVSRFARWTGLDRDRAFYSTMVIVVASYYVLFAAMGGSTPTLVIETIVMIVFVLVAVMGFRFNPWLIVAGLAGHGVFDLFHDLVVENPGVPEWWPGFCLAFDVGAAALLACSQVRGSTRKRRPALEQTPVEGDEGRLLAFRQLYEQRVVDGNTRLDRT